MGHYPDNVIPFPGRPRPISARRVADRQLPADITKMLTEEPSSTPPEGNLRFLSLTELGKLDFPITANPEVYSEAMELDHLLGLLAKELGVFKSRKLGEVMGKYLASVADMSYAEGLAETITAD